MSFRRQVTSFSLYSLSPFLKKRRVTVIVLNSVGSRLRVFSKVRLTSARPLALRLLEPLNTSALWFSLRNALIFCSPITQRMLSIILLLPQPLGPMMPVIPSSKLSTVLSAKLLNPFISKLFNRIIFQFNPN